MRHLVIVLGDQLDRNSSAFDGFDPSCDCIWMAEVEQESTHVWSHKARIALFLSAMRHFAVELQQRGWPVTYLRLDEHDFVGLGDALRATLIDCAPERVVMVVAGDHRVQQIIESTCRACGVPLESRPDRHFITHEGEFEAWAKGRKVFRLEHWYRALRKRTGVLMDGHEPIGGRWNFDADNRAAFDERGPGLIPEPLGFAPDEITREVISLVARRFAGHPGKLERFDWPVTPVQARQALNDFVTHRLPMFGLYQDAMWSGQHWLYHSRLSAALNLKLIDPLTVCHAVEEAFREGHAPIEAAEGFIRQVLGWREYVRGLYVLWMPDWLSWNALEAHAPLPDFFWTSETDMACLQDVIGQTLATGYAHHIQRLMVTGLYCLLLGVEPRRVHEWFLAVYVDAVEWVELPNVLGMSQHADGGRMASKPYIASGKYIQRMSNYCSGCRYRPELASGDGACPITTLYWDFLHRHRPRFENHPRLAQQVWNLDRKTPAEIRAIQRRADALRSCHGAGGIIR